MIEDDVVDVFADQHDFMAACDQPTNNKSMGLYIALIEEEFNELKEAKERFDAEPTNANLGEIVDALFDIMYVTAGAMNCATPFPGAIWKYGHSNNMTKVDPATGKVRKREDGKVIKPEGYRKPNFAKALELLERAQHGN